MTKQIARFQGGSVGPREFGEARGVGFEAFTQAPELPGKIRRQREAIPGEGDCGRDDFLSCQRAMALEHGEQTIDAAGYADGQMGGGGQSVDDIGVLVQEHVAMGLEGGFLAVVVGDEFAVGQPDHHESAPAEVPGGGVRHRQREAHGDRGVDGIAALAHYADSDLGRKRRTGSNRALRAAGFLGSMGRQADADDDGERNPTRNP